MLVKGKLFLIIVVLFVQIGCGSDSGDGNGSEGSGTNTDDSWLIPQHEVQDGGPGKDGIPSIDSPLFVSADSELGQALSAQALIVGILDGSQARAYPHAILDWHEIVNDFTGEIPIVLSYCPLTGSAIAWESPSRSVMAQYGVSGLLYNSNLILYDRETNSNWAQMMQKSVNGQRIGENLDDQQIFLVETTWQQWQAWFPTTELLSTNTGYSRNYSQYPYGNYLSTETTLFATDNTDDKRLHPKSRALGVHIGGMTKVYQISEFDADLQVLNEDVGGQIVVIVGSSEGKFGLAWNRMFEGETLTFSAVFDDSQLHLQDQHGRTWDVFGRGVSDELNGKQLDSVTHYTAYWFAWTAFFDDVQIHQF